MTHPQTHSIRVVYIVGCGRSGSTLLNTILGNHPEIVSLGELRRLAIPNRLSDFHCSCNALLGKCPFWQNVLQHWYRYLAVKDLDAYWQLQLSFEHYRNLPRLWLEQHQPSPHFEQYARQTMALLESILVVSGKRIIVDSSKSPMRALAFSMIPSIDLRLIHLVRDGRGMAWSYKKTFEKDLRSGIIRQEKAIPVWSAARAWLLGNVTANWLRQQVGPERSMLCRYEDIVTKPEQILTMMGSFIRCDLTPVIEAIVAGQPLVTGHTAGGNRMRMASGIKLKPDIEWQKRLTPIERLIFYTLTGWLMRQYGYTGTVVKRRMPSDQSLGASGISEPVWELHGFRQPSH